MKRVLLLAAFIATIVIGLTSGQTSQRNPLAFRADIVDATQSPCADFYRYACNNWMKTHPIPPDRSSWDPYYELAQKNDEIVRRILEGKEGDRNPLDRKVRDYYAACMDEDAIQKNGLSAIMPELNRIEAIRTSVDAVRALGMLHALGSDALFSFYPNQDPKNAEQVIATIDVASLGMTDRTYYLKDDKTTNDLRQKYLEHVTHMLELSGLRDMEAGTGAAAVLKIETEMAKLEPSRELRRDPNKQYHRMTVAELQDLSPSWPWSEYFRAVKAPGIRNVNVTSPEYLKPMIAFWGSLSLKEQKAYLRWHLVHALAAAFPENFVKENFHLYGEVLRGIHQLSPRWRRCANLANAHLGDAIGRIFVALHFDSAAKHRVVEIIRAIQAALHDDLSTATWMSETTRRAAIEKLAAYRIKVGYPDTWRDYAGLIVRPNDALGNAVRAYRYEFARKIQKIGKPVDRDEWFSLPQEVDGYQSSALVEIVFTAGFLQPPFFDPDLDDPVNFGAVGRAIGHEFTHGFDDRGRKFDSHGNLRDWWTKDDAQAFQEHSSCFVDEYSSFAVLGNKLNGRLTLGENIADNGGIRLAYLAMEKYLEGKPRKLIDGLTPEQRFFLAFAETQCVNTADQTLRNRLLTDPHSPGQWRVNGTVMNMPEFKAAFGCSNGDAMVNQKPCRLW